MNSDTPLPPEAQPQEDSLVSDEPTIPPPDDFMPPEADLPADAAAVTLSQAAANPLAAPAGNDPSQMLYNPEAEKAVLGAILINPEAYYEISDFLQADDFYIERNRWVWEAIVKAKSEQRQLDPVTLSATLEEAGHLAELGGQAYIASLLDNVPSSLHVRDYARIVEASAIRRRLLTAADQIARKAHDPKIPVDFLLTEAEKEVFNVSERRLSSVIQPIGQVLADYLTEVEERASRDEDIVGVPTDFYDLDRLLNGLQPSDLIIIAGRPGQGKTGLLLNIAKNAALQHKKHVAIFSLEMSNLQLVQRLVAQQTGINSQRLSSGKLTPDDWPLLAEAVNALEQTTIFLDDTPAITPMQLRTKCRRLHMEHKLDLVIIDYLQLMGGDKRTDNRVQEVSYISRNLKVLARELNVPVVAAAQLSRAVEQRTDKHPQLSDLRESGSLEQDADIVMFIYRDEYYNPDTEKKNVAEIIIAKHRNGPTGTVELIFEKELTRFRNAAYLGTNFRDQG